MKFLRMTPKQDFKARSGTLQSHLNPNRRGWANQESRQYSSALTESAWTRTTEWICTIIPKEFWKGYGNKFFVRVQPSRATGYGAFSAALFLGEFPPQKAHQLHHSLQSTRFSSLQPFFIPKIKESSQVAPLWRFREHQNGFNGPIKDDSGFRAPALP